MRLNDFKRRIRGIVREAIDESWYTNSAAPVITRTGVNRDLGRNPMYADNGNHTSRDAAPQVSTFDRNGEAFKTSGDNTYVVSDNKFTFYKVKNFGNDRIASTMSLFGNGSAGEKGLRAAIDTVNGAAVRNSRRVDWRTITSVSNQKLSSRTGGMSGTFWEFSLDGGNTWNILKPNPTQDMKRSGFVPPKPTAESLLREAADSTFSTQELSSIPSFKKKVEYCNTHLGKPIGSGSSRKVYQIDDEKVLKLAFNKKGIAQNEAESEWYKQNFDCIPKVYEADDNGLWVVSEYVLPAKVNDFKVCLGLTFDEFVSFIGAVYNQYDRNRFARYRPYRMMDDDRFEELIETNEALQDINNYMSDYQPPLGDLTRLRNIGLAKRYGEPYIVFLDHGLTDDIFDQYYTRR
ncbi:MAG: hypothetical protein J6Y37_06780 [Paludibacteraceae bacterium]|nr:hypothetical protein [Paludibacteraceae bacterium]